MALLPIIGLAAPLVAGLLDRFGSFRMFQHLGLGLFAVGFGVLALADELIGAALGAFILGTGAAFVLTTDMSLLAESGLSDTDLTRRMSELHMSVPIGQVAGLATLALLLELEVDFSGIFLVFALLSLGALAATAATNDAAVARTIRHKAATQVGAAEAEAAPEASMGLGAVLLSSFGLLLLVVFLSAAAQTSIET